ncbi:general stress protein [Kocuria sp.]|uniref:general stress protein n=1 Tax=Kocuria sp. TaxID=1871328 RepID=UPI0026DB7FD9|nr:general stress protein [Kocuria sp.]MDO4918871.1 hypothetical protein [Kocuria sp.]
MTNPNRSPAQLSIAPEMPRGEVVGRYRTYAEAQKAVDYMSDEHFPVAMVSIIGSDLKSVEQVTGRLSYPKVALQGALNGVFFGAFFGLIMSMFGGANMASSVLLTMLLGGAFFMLMATITYAMSRGKRDFTSTSRIVAGSYEVLAAPEVAGQARQVLGSMPDGPGTGYGPQGPARNVPGQNPSAPYGGPQNGRGQYGGAPMHRGPDARPGHWGPQNGAPHGGGFQGGPAQGAQGGDPRQGGVDGRGSTAQSAPGAPRGAHAPADDAAAPDPQRSAKFPDLPDGRPQYGIRVEPSDGAAPAPWTRDGSAAQQGDPGESRQDDGPVTGNRGGADDDSAHNRG